MINPIKMMNKTMNNEILRAWFKKNYKNLRRPGNKDILLCHELLYLL